MILLKLKKIKAKLDVIHFIGIGGIGMSGIAEILNNLGYKVQGSDSSKNANVDRLRLNNIKIFDSHDQLNILGASYVVVSTAIPKNNVEYQEAIKQKIPVISRAEMLAELMRLKCSVAISGSHGKTTTTSLIACLFEASGLNPTVINGGIINHKETNAYIGSGDYLIAEADESDATFIHIPSTIAVITNIDPEHMDFYKNFDNLFDSFKKFILNLPFYGFAVCCIDHPNVRNLVSQITERKMITYGIESDDAHIIAFNINMGTSFSNFDIKINMPNITGNIIIENINIPTPGRHNILNALAAIAVAVELDFGINVIKNGFKNFSGIKRRFTKIMEYKGAQIIDDYAHHPVEVSATIETAKSIVKKSNAKVIAIFQPHRYSRVNLLFDEFTKCFAEADLIYILDIYAAGEAQIDKINSQNLVDSIKRNSLINVHYLESHNNIPDVIINNAKNGDIVLMMGAGSITYWANDLVNILKN